MGGRRCLGAGPAFKGNGDRGGGRWTGSRGGPPSGTGGADPRQPHAAGRDAGRAGAVWPYGADGAAGPGPPLPAPGLAIHPGRAAAGRAGRAPFDCTQDRRGGRLRGREPGRCAGRRPVQLSAGALARSVPHSAGGGSSQPGCCRTTGRPPALAASGGRDCTGHWRSAPRRLASSHDSRLAIQRAALYPRLDLWADRGYRPW